MFWCHRCRIPSFRAPGTFSSSALPATQLRSSGSTPGMSRGAPKRGNSGIQEFWDGFANPLFHPLRPPPPAPGINEGEAGLGHRAQGCQGDKLSPKNIGLVLISLLHNLFFFHKPYFGVSTPLKGGTAPVGLKRGALRAPHKPF